LAAILSAASWLKADTVFDLQGVPENTPTPFADTQNGITATFTGINAGGVPTAGWFIVGGPGTNQFFQIFGPGAHFLIQPDTNNFGSLQIDFSQSVTNLIVPFAINNPPVNGVYNPLNIFLNGFLAGTGVGSTQSTGTLTQENPDQYPEGTLTLFGTFDRLVFTSEASGFAVGNFDVDATIPEPASLPLLSIGLAGVGLAYVIRKRIAVNRAV